MPLAPMLRRRREAPPVSQTLEEENKELSSKLEAAEKKASAKPTMPVDSAEVKNLRADLDKSRGDLEKSRADRDKARAEVAELKKQVAAKPAVAVDGAEVKSLRAQLSDARKEAEQARSKSAARAAELEKQNADLSAKLAAAAKNRSRSPDRSARRAHHETVARGELVPAQSVGHVFGKEPRVEGPASPVRTVKRKCSDHGEACPQLVGDRLRCWSPDAAESIDGRNGVDL